MWHSVGIHLPSEEDAEVDGKIPKTRKCSLLKHSFLKKSMDREVWPAVQGCKEWSMIATEHAD